MTYSPARRTALVLCGTGAHGAYHAGVLRALQEAGVKVDVIAGHGVGAGAAAVAAIDGGARLWEPDGIWRSPGHTRYYGWTRSIRIAGWLTLLLLLVLCAPISFLVAGVVVYSAAFLLEMLGSSAGPSLVSTYSSWLRTAFSGPQLPTTIPRLAMALVASVIGVLVAGMLFSRLGRTAKRRAERGWWWGLIGSPLDAEPARRAFSSAIWHLIRGAAGDRRPPVGPVVGRRYAEVLGENLGQPGFRELMIIATDLDSRSDVIAAMLREPYRREFIASRPGRERRAEVLDLAGLGRDYACEVMHAALTPPLASAPRLVTFAPDGYWRGETHRLCDRPGSVARLFEELAAAGVSQAIVASAVPAMMAPHRLRAPRLDIRGRLGEFIEASESASLHDAMDLARLRFDSFYVICPAHNPVGPFDFGGAYDEASDRRHSTQELMERAYEDAYHQFIEPVVGASGEQLVGRSS